MNDRVLICKAPSVAPGGACLNIRILEQFLHPKVMGITTNAKAPSPESSAPETTPSPTVSWQAGARKSWLGPLRDPLLSCKASIARFPRTSMAFRAPCVGGCWPRCSTAHFVVQCAVLLGSEMILILMRRRHNAHSENKLCGSTPAATIGTITCG
jgi:hypothetical protein